MNTSKITSARVRSELQAMTPQPETQNNTPDYSRYIAFAIVGTIVGAFAACILIFGVTGY